MKVKKIMAAAAVLCLALLLTACKTETASENAGKTENQTTGEVQSLTALTFGNPAVSRSHSFTNQGYYQILDKGENGRNIQYIDFASQQQIYLCDRPECLHNDESCSSYLEDPVSKLLVSPESNKLLIFTARFDEDKGVTVPKLISMDMDGSNRKELCVFPDDGFTRGQYVCSASELFFVNDIPDYKKQSVKTVLEAINLETGETREITELKSGERIISACQDIIYLEKWNGDKNETEYVRCNAQTGEMNTAISLLSNEWDLDTSTCFDNMLYQYSPQEDALYQINLDNGEKKVCVQNFSESVPLSEKTSLNYIDMMDRHLFLETTVPDPDHPEYHWYAVDLATGEITEQQMFFKRGNGNNAAYPVAETEDDFLIVYQYETKTVTLYGKGDAPYEATDIVPCYGILSKADFYQNRIDNIKPITYFG